jgi:hypothetical protein
MISNTEPESMQEVYDAIKLINFFMAKGLQLPTQHYSQNALSQKLYNLSSLSL